jgi:hypothetical protein
MFAKLALWADSVNYLCCLTLCVSVCFHHCKTPTSGGQKKDLVDGPCTNLGQCSDETIVEKIKSH